MEDALRKRLTYGLSDTYYFFESEKSNCCALSHCCDTWGPPFSCQDSWHP
ncbi:hypothetical protein LguiA_005048 [Lonicera macranthoides]